MLKVAVVEDEDECANALNDALLKFRNECGETIESVRFTDGLNFIEEYTADFDIIFMDIKMPHLNGMQASRQLRERDKNVVIVFLTNFVQYARFGYEVEAARYLLKPVNYSDINSVMRYVIERRKDNEKAYFVIKDKNGFGKIMYRDIVYVESDNHYCMIHCFDGSSKRMLVPMKKIEQILHGGGYSFFKCHNSYLVNIMYVKNVLGDEVKLQGGTVLPISRAKRAEFVDGLTRLLQ